MATERPEGQESDGESIEMRPPKETKEEIPDIGALVRAETRVERGVNFRA
jgi:hypothetical protein